MLYDILVGAKIYPQLMFKNQLLNPSTDNISITTGTHLAVKHFPALVKAVSTSCRFHNSPLGLRIFAKPEMVLRITMQEAATIGPMADDNWSLLVDSNSFLALQGF